MSIHEVGKFLQRYGVPVVIGLLLAFGLIFTSMQDSTPRSTKSPNTVRSEQHRNVRGKESPSAKPTEEEITEPVPAPTEGDLPRTADIPFELETTQPTEPPTTTQVTQSPEAMVSINNGPALREPHIRHTMTSLSDGKVLIIGGSRAEDEHLFDVDLYDPAANTFSQLAPLSIMRHDHTATLLDDGRVLITGGYSFAQQWLSDAEVYDFDTDSWDSVPPLYSHGTAHTATVMENGRVLVVGGCIDSGVCTEIVEIFDPSSDSWTEAASLDFDLYGHTAQLLGDGRVIIIGGMSASGNNPDVSALIYDPDLDAWTATTPMVHPRFLAKSVRLADGRILVVGGLSLEAQPENRTLTSAEIYDPETDKWIPAGTLSQPRYAFQLVESSDGQVLAIGGTRTYESNWNANSFVGEIERYDVVSNRWLTAGLLSRPSAFSASALLPDGRIWLTGGQNDTTYFQDTWLITIAP